jgi:predicted RNase H-like HicB family nuclease
MQVARIRYHAEHEGWWADSEELPGWTAVGKSFEEVRAEALRGVREFAGEVLIEEEGVPLNPASSGANRLESFVNSSFSMPGVSLTIAVNEVPPIHTPRVAAEGDRWAADPPMQLTQAK